MSRTVILTALFQTIPSVTSLTQLVAFLVACFLANGAVSKRR